MPDQDPSQPVPFTEDCGDVAVAFGIHPKVLRDLRRDLLVEGVDFEFRANRCFLSAPAAEKLRAVIVAEPARGLSDAAEAPIAPPAAENAPPAGQEAALGRRKARVVSRLRDFGGLWRQHFPNPRVIEVEFADEKGGRAFVRVSHSRNYAQRTRTGDPMELEVVWRGSRWEASGRAPRYPGRW